LEAEGEPPFIRKPFPVGSYVPPGYIFVDHSKNKSNSTVTSPERDKEQA
jgi:hypothetical protein